MTSYVSPILILNTVESGGVAPAADINPEYLAGRLGTGVGSSGTVAKFRSNIRPLGHASREQSGRKYMSSSVATI